jgi:hypothetical protein
MQMNSIQERLLRSVKNELSRFQQDPELRAYERAWENHFKKNWLKSNANRLYHVIRRSSLIVLGDFHGYDQSQRTHLRLLRTALTRQEKKATVCLVLECFKPQDEKILKSWLAGKISDERLLKETKWVKNWGFSWQNYRPLLELAKERGWGVTGLSTTDRSLEQRDKWAAHRCLELKNSYSKVVLVFGDFHLSPHAFPKWIRKRDPQLYRNTVWVHQNAKALFEKSREAVHSGKTAVYALGANEFCVMNSAPWVKWTSHLAFSAITESELDDEPFQEVILSLGRNWSKYLDIEWDPTDWDLITWRNKSKVTRNRSADPFIRNLVTKNIGFVDPNSRTVYLPRPSLNLGSHLIAQTIWYSQSLSGKSNHSLTENTFASQLFIEMFGFCFSKCFNPYRPSRTLIDLARETVSDPLAKEGYLACKRFAQNPKSMMVKARLTSGEFYAARRLGSYLGEIWWRTRSARDRDEANVLRFFVEDWTAMKWNNLIIQLWKASQKIRLESKGERL